MLLLDEQCMDLEDAGSVNNSTARFYGNSEAMVYV